MLALRHTGVVTRRNATYTVVLEEEPEGNWHAYAPAVRGCFAGGKTRSEALRRYRSALQLHLDELLAQGRALPKERHAPAVQIVVAA
jgi:predicted RNase H-like HicB family nuclease